MIEKFLLILTSLKFSEPPGGATPTPSPAPSPAHASSGQMNTFSHPDSDDPIAQTIYRMIEPEDKVHIMLVHTSLIVLLCTHYLLYTPACMGEHTLVVSR